MTPLRQPTTLRHAMAAIVAATVAHPALASNLTFLKDSAISKFDDEDVRLMMEAVRAVVSDTETPAQRDWKNDKTGHHGELRTLSAFAGPNGLNCKRLRIANHAGSLASKSTYTLCDMPPDGWRLVPSDFARPPTRKP